jgi:hypothetical protein
MQGTDIEESVVRGREGGGMLPKQRENQKGKRRPVINQLLASGTYEHFLSELKEVAFCRKMLKSILKIKVTFFDQIMTYFLKFNFRISGKFRE